jgi:hypothetical protein
MDQGARNFFSDDQLAHFENELEQLYTLQKKHHEKQGKQGQLGQQDPRDERGEQGPHKKLKVEDSKEERGVSYDDLCAMLIKQSWKMDSLLLEKMNTEQRKRVPRAVFENKRCMVCWSASCGLNCKRCKLWSLCLTCSSELEDNCLQCLFVDQESAARKALMRRTLSFEDASRIPS